MNIQPNIYRTNTCGELRDNDAGKNVRIAGWIESIRDHGGLMFFDLRDHYGVVQVVARDASALDGIHRETVVSVTGTVVLRSEETINPKIRTGRVEVVMSAMTVLGRSQAVLPFEVQTSRDTREEVRLKYRYIDLRNWENHNNIVKRSQIVSRLREKMNGLGFLEITTPILTCSSPEGARDYLVPSRKHPGKFYSLPQAPQIFKQLLMVSGFDRYFQIAPCFRDEDARADRSPGEFYQLDYEMAFAEQEDVFAVTEEVIYDVFSEFSDKKVNKPPFPRIPYAEAMLKYGCDKPDLRNPIEIADLTAIFADTEFGPFKGKIVRGIAVDGLAKQPNSFFDRLGKAAGEAGLKGLGYLKVDGGLNLSGPIAKYMSDARKSEMIAALGLKPDSAVLFIADDQDAVDHLASVVRAELGERLGVIEKDAFRMCFVMDFPMYETNEETGKTDFTHNPFSMPQGEMKALTEKDPLEVIAYQYDLVCNGIELSSGAVRNHDPEIMLKAFEIAGYTEEEILTQFGALYNAFKYGAPPHAGMAPGIDRIVMLITGEQNIREVIAFPMNNNAQDVMLGAPSEVGEKQLREVHIKLR